MLLQRLKDEKDIGFNYDYMGSAEYENEATTNGRLAVAKIFVESKICARRVELVEKYGVNKSRPISVLAVGKEETLNRLGNPMIIGTSKSRFRTEDENITGWLHVGHHEDVEPLLLARLNENNDLIQEKIEAFLKGPIDYLQENL